MLRRYGMTSAHNTNLRRREHNFRNVEVRQRLCLNEDILGLIGSRLRKRSIQNQDGNAR